MAIFKQKMGAKVISEDKFPGFMLSTYVRCSPWPYPYQKISIELQRALPAPNDYYILCTFWHIFDSFIDFFLK